MTGRAIRVAAWVLTLAMTASGGCSSAQALGDEPKPGETVTQYLTPDILEMIFPGADKLGEVGGTPAAAAVLFPGRLSELDTTVGPRFHERGPANRHITLVVTTSPCSAVAAAIACSEPSITTRPRAATASSASANLRKSAAPADRISSRRR